jgi:hypothetical protein
VTARAAFGCGAIVLAVSVLSTCEGYVPFGLPALLQTGTWGGDNAGAIVTDSVAHVHVGCTYGDIPGRVALDGAGNFSADGSYLLRAYPIAVGPSLPARFSGSADGKTLTITVVVNDTVNHTTVTKGPVTLKLGQEPAMGPCPICRTPGERAKLMGGRK